MQEQNAIIEIIDQVEKNLKKYEILSSETQLNQLYSKLHSLNTTQNRKQALEFVIAQIESLPNNSFKSDPQNSNNIRDQLLQITSLPDKEDAKQIAIAWIRKADYFITVDWKSILNLNHNNFIGKTLSSFQHPTTSVVGQLITVTDPRTFLNLMNTNSI